MNGFPDVGRLVGCIPKVTLLSSEGIFEVVCDIGCNVIDNVEKANNIIFCIFGCDTIDGYKKEILKIKETWGKATQLPTDKPPEGATASDSNHLLFFLGEEGPFTGDEYIHLENVENDYLSASYKQYGGLKYIYENYNFQGSSWS